MRETGLSCFTNIRSGENVEQVADWIKKNVLLEGM